MFDVDRILAIPDYAPEYVQMGLSTHNRGVLRARGYKRGDGIEAKDRFIKLDKKLEAREKAIIKGDKPLAEAPKELTGAARIRARIRARFEQKQREQYNIPIDVSVDDFLAEKEKQRKDDVEKNKSQRKKTWGEVERKDYSKKSDYHLAEIEALKDSATINALEKNKASVAEVESTLEKERKRFSKLSERGMDQMSGGNRSTSKATAAYGAQMAARGIDSLEKYLDARKGLDNALKAETPEPVFRELDSSIAKKVKGAIADQRSINSSGRRSGKSNTQKSDQAYQLHEKTKQSHEKARDKFIGLSDELGALRDKAQEAKGKVETGRTKKRASEMKDAFKFNNALEAEAMNNGQAVPVMRQKANKKQMASINDKINQKENEMFAAQSRTNQLKARANKLFDASQDYSNKNDATPSKSRKVIKGKSPRDRGSKPNQESTPQKTPYEVAKEFGVKSTVTGNVKRINAKTKPELIEKALEHHFAQEKASRHLSAGKKSGLPQYQNLDEKTVRGFAAKVFAGYVTPNLQDFNGMTNGGGSDFSGYVKAGLLKDVQSDRGQRHPLTSVGREFAKEIMASKSKGEFADQAKAAINPKPKQQSPTAKKLNLTAAKEAEILKSIKRF